MNKSVAAAGGQTVHHLAIRIANRARDFAVGTGLGDVVAIVTRFGRFNHAVAAFDGGFGIVWARIDDFWLIPIVGRIDGRCGACAPQKTMKEQSKAAYLAD